MDYANGKIYRIVCNKTGLQYIGSTCTTLVKRLWYHKNHFKRWKAGKQKNTVTSFKLLENDDAEIFLIEDYPCERKEQLHAQERYWIETLDCVNKIIPGRTDKEYREANKDKIRDKSIEKIKEYYQTHKDKISSRTAEWRANNKEALFLKKKAYRDANKDKIKAYDAEKVSCECGSVVRRNGLAEHRNSNKHQDWLATNN
jgi:hypothetical protein